MSAASSITVPHRVFFQSPTTETRPLANDEHTSPSPSPSPSPPASPTRDLESGRPSFAELNEKSRLRRGHHKDGRLEPSKSLTGHQLFYIVFLDGLGGMTISAGVNFAIAYAMYMNQNTAIHPIRLFQLPNTLAGDAAVTIIIQCILTWFIELLLVHYDLSKHGVQPIGFVREPRRPLLRRLMQLPARPLPPDQHLEPTARMDSVSAIVQQALRGFLLAVLGFLILWPVSVGVLSCLGTPSGGDFVFAKKWTPQFFKFVLGGTLGLLTTPLMAMFWLVKAGWEFQHNN